MVEFDGKKFSKNFRRAEVVSLRHARKFLVARIDNVKLVRRRITAWLVLVGVLIAAVGLQLLEFQRAYQTLAPAQGGTYAEAVSGTINTLNPLYAVTAAEIAVSRLMFSSLYAYDRTGNLRGDLAENVQIDESSKSYTVKLREDAKWHDGRRVTANDVAFTINLIRDPAARSPLRSSWEGVEVSVLNDYTVRFRLSVAYAPFMHSLTFSVLPEHILRNVESGSVRESSFSRSPVGSGPFEFRLFQQLSAGKDKDYQIVQMAAYSNHYAGRPRVNRFEVYAYTSEEDMVRAINRREVNAASSLSPVVLSGLNGDEYGISTHPVDSGVYALFNTARPPLSDKTVREALRSAIDIAKLRTDISADVLPLDLPFLNSQVGGVLPTAPAFDASKAALLLDQAGWRTGPGGVRQKNGQKLILALVTVKDNEFERVTESLAATWRRLGIEVNATVVDITDPTANFTKNILQPRNYDVLINELFIGADPDVYAFWHSSQTGVDGRNFTNYKNVVVDDLLSSARSRRESELRSAKYRLFAEKWLADVPAVGLYQPVVKYVTKRHVKSVENGVPFVSPGEHYANVLDWSVREQPVYKTP